MKNRSFQIALSAVSCALASIFMIVGMNVPFVFATGYIFAEIALMLPLAKDFRIGGFLAFAASALICLPLGGIAAFYKFFPFIVFFGLHPLINALFGKSRLNRWFAFAVKAVWFVGAMCGAWAIFCAMTEVSLPFAWMYDWAYLLIVVGGAAVFFVYDWLMQRAQKLVCFYISKIDGSKTAKGAHKRVPDVRDDIADVFGGAPLSCDGGGEEKTEKDRDETAGQDGGQGARREEKNEKKDNEENVDGQ